MIFCRGKNIAPASVSTWLPGISVWTYLFSLSLKKVKIPILPPSAWASFKNKETNKKPIKDQFDPGVFLVAKNYFCTKKTYLHILIVNVVG